MVKKLLVGLMMFMFMAGGALAIDMPECWVDVDPMENGEECWEVYYQADFRYYHDSAEHSDEMYNPGGYKIGVSFWNFTSTDNKVEFRSNQGYSLVVPAIPVYTFMGTPVVEHLIWLGTDWNAKGLWDAYINDELVKTNISLVLGTPKIPVVTLHKMKKKANGIEIKFSAPMAEGFRRINLRIFDATGEDFAHEIRYTDISKAINDTIPLEYSGREGRFEYRTSYGARTLLYITLP